MAVVTVSGTDRPITDPRQVSAFLADHGIWYRRFEGLDRLAGDVGDAAILAAFDAPIQEQMERGGYTTADVVDLAPTTPNLDAMLARFSSEHWHSEDEVRFIVEGRGIFHLNLPGAPVFSIETESGDLINVPAGTQHWFDLCSDKTIRCIRLFQDPAGWAPHYVDEGVHEDYTPVCWGPNYLTSDEDDVDSVVKL